MGEPVNVLVITGPVGAGKSTVASAISDLLYEQDVPHALIDMDDLRRVHPTPPGDRFAAGMSYRNLAAIWPNLCEVNPRYLIIADVVENRTQVREYDAALPGTCQQVIRLNVPMELIISRLRVRESASRFDWYAHRAAELQAIMERERVGDIVIDVGTRDPDVIALEVLRIAGLVPDIE